MAVNRETETFAPVAAPDGVEEPVVPTAPAPVEETGSLGELTQAAGKTAVAAALAGAVATGAAALAPEQIVLPDIPPMVQTLNVGTGGDLPDSVLDEGQQDAATKSSIWEKIFQILKYALIALFVVAGVVFGVLQGCASCAGPLAVPGQSTQEASSSEAPAETS